MPVSASHRTWTLVLTAVASLMVALDLLVVATALPTIRADLGASIATLQWTVTGYGLAFAALLMPAAALGDRFGRRRVFTIGLALFGGASAACALAPEAGWLIAARVAQGAGAAMVMPLAMALLGAAFPPDERGRALGLLEGATGFATIRGPPLGGVMAQVAGWQWIFAINVPIALVAIPLVLRHVADDRAAASPRTTLDLPGMALVGGGALALVWGLVRGAETGWARADVLVALGLGVGLAAAFVTWERRTPAPMLPPGLFRSRAFSAGTGVSVLLFAALYGSVFLLGQILQTGLGYDPAAAGLALVPWTACLLVVAPVAGALADRIGHRPLLVGGLALDAAGLAWFALAASPGVAYVWLLAPMLVAGVGASAAIPVVQGCVLGAVPPAEIGQASGVNSASQELGGVFGVAVLVTVLASVGDAGTADGFLEGAAPALMVAAGLAALGALVALLVPRPPRTTEQGRPGRTNSVARSTQHASS